MLLFVGRIQPLKAPEVLIKAAAELLARHPHWSGELVVAVLGGPSGSGLAHPRGLQELAEGLGISAQVRFVPPVPRSELAGVVPRGRPGGRAFPLGVVRAGRRRGAGLRHAGRRCRCRRPPHGGR